MSFGASRPRGQPLRMLGLLLLVWIGGRVMLWQSPFPDQMALNGRDGAQLAVTGGDADRVTMAPLQGGAARESIPGSPRPSWQSPKFSDAPQLALFANHAGDLASPEYAAGILESNSRIAGGHQLLWMAAMAWLPLPSGLVDGAGPATPPHLPRLAAPPRSRWSLDSWVFLREGSGAAAITEGRVPSYGASQAAAILSYRLAPGAARDLRAYLRAYRALIENGESELALGFSARPLAALPLRAHAELRATERQGGIGLRPAAIVSSELAPLALPFRLRAEAYAQAGYVGGKGATGFADGQLHVLRDVERFELGQLSLGAAAWGGAQEGSERIDLGPSLRLDLKLERVPARLALDYRERVAGNAEPRSGGALTLSTRF